MRKQVLTAVVLALGASACVPIGPGGGFNPGPQYASSQQIFNTLANFSVVGSLSDGTSYCEWHSPSGQVVGRDYQSYQGSWQVSGANQICYNYPQSGVFNDCQNVVLNGNQATFYSNGQVISSGNLVGGNIC